MNSVLGARGGDERRDFEDSDLLAGARSWLAAVALRPWLWPVAATQSLRMARRGWWRRWPPLPLPEPELWRFRMETAYGDSARKVPPARDVRSFLEWCRAAHNWRKR